MLISKIISKAEVFITNAFTSGHFVFLLVWIYNISFLESGDKPAVLKVPACAENPGRQEWEKHKPVGAV
jgi:hypothetical protein